MTACAVGCLHKRLQKAVRSEHIMPHYVNVASGIFFPGIRAAGGGGWRQTVFLFGVVRLDAAL